ncbi:hypothetical protein C9374_013512 [Naegleria lovaniensis]|uniref:F-box domain-containing protein n=1 Tax=Naegleria lovaniensis TaxID=51637 RepID=A0AA88H2J0_NAELO|nr:uncharacterized protein C9374_013512 [Naegleria lovaniensis]KAG2392027.1 hypothetical protein C9374_013512 [Naegleria lovaniensis]
MWSLFKKQKKNNHDDDEDGRVHKAILLSSIFTHSDIFHYIVMSGYLRLEDILNLRMVCKMWNDHVESGWSAFQYHVLVQLFQLRVPDLALQHAQHEPSAKSTTMLFFSMVKACRGIRTGLEHPSFSSFRETTVFGVPLKPKEKEQIMQDMQDMNQHDEEDLASQFLSFKFYQSLPHITPPVKKDYVLEFIPKFLNGKRNYWVNLNHDQWFGQHRVEHNNIIVKSLLWSQRIFNYSYDEFNFDMVLHLEGDMFKTKKMIEKLFLVKTVQNSIVKEGPIRLDPALFHTKFGYVLTDSCFQAERSHTICKQVTTFSKFTLKYIEAAFLNHFGEEVDLLVKDSVVPQGLDTFFNQELERTLFQLWSTGLLNVKFIRNFVFRLLVALSHRRHDWYSLSFHDSIQESCPNTQATNGVMEWFNEYARTRTQEYPEIIHTFVKDHEIFQGFHEGEQIQSYLLALMLKPNVETQTCQFQVLKYLFYEFSLDGEILS